MFDPLNAYKKTLHWIILASGNETNCHPSSIINKDSESDNYMNINLTDSRNRMKRAMIKIALLNNLISDLCL